MNTREELAKVLLADDLAEERCCAEDTWENIPDSWRQNYLRRADRLLPWVEQQVGKYRVESDWLRSLSPDKLSWDNGYLAGWSAAHAPANCGHASGNWKDPKFGTSEYGGDEKCEACAAVAAERERLSSPFAALLSAAESKDVSVCAAFVPRWVELLRRANEVLGITAIREGGKL